MNLERQNNLPTIESALRLLTAVGYATQELWKEHNDWLQSEETVAIGPKDAVWSTNRGSPPSTSAHFDLGANEVLSAWNAANGFSYQLSPGQRRYLRNRFGMTPTATVTISRLAYFKDTKVISTFLLSSDEHVPNNRRRHVLNEVVLSSTDFFERCAAFDKEIEAERSTAGPSKAATKAKAQADYVAELVAAYGDKI